MSIKECAFKENNFCNLNKENISEIEKRCNFKCLESCWWINPTYKGKDKVNLLLEEYHLYMKNKNLKDVDMIRFLNGHDCGAINDYYDISYQAALISLVVRKYKDIKSYEYLEAVDYMKLLNFKVPKSIKRKYIRIKNNLEIKNDFHYKLYLNSINTFKESLKD